MRPRRVQSEPLPRETLRDLLAISRTLYRVRADAGAAVEELERIERAGKAFAQALEFSKLKPDTIGHRAGWGWADKGLELLTEALADAGTSGAELARVAGERLKWKD